MDIKILAHSGSLWVILADSVF